MAKNVLVVAAHPDDEILGCGATMARHAAEGDRVTVLLMADGVGARNPENASAALAQRQNAARKANKILGLENVTLLTYPDNRMDTVALLDIVQDVEKLIRQCAPEIVYTHHSGDVNIDHRLVSEAVVVASRSTPGFSVRQLLFFETASSTEWRPPVSGMSFAPNYFVNVSNYLALKLQALEVYSEELRAFPHPRSKTAIAHLAAWRGATVGVDAAEAFELARAII
jgi:LmbE family N-acetylglucosaminyl deacetylase